MSQGPSLSGVTAEVLEHADRHGIPTLDLIGRVNELGADGPGIFERFVDGQMTLEGNRWVAEEIAAILQRLEEAGGEDHAAVAKW